MRPHPMLEVANLRRILQAIDSVDAMNRGLYDENAKECVRYGKGFSTVRGHFYQEFILERFKAVNQKQVAPVQWNIYISQTPQWGQCLPHAMTLESCK